VQPDGRTGDDLEVRTQGLDLDLQRRRTARLVGAMRRAPPVNEGREARRAYFDLLEIPTLEAIAQPVERISIELAGGVDIDFVVPRSPGASGRGENDDQEGHRQRRAV